MLNLLRLLCPSLLGVGGLLLGLALGGDEFGQVLGLRLEEGLALAELESHIDGALLIMNNLILTLTIF